MHRRLNIGVLALQGDFEAHRSRLERLGARATLARKPQELEGVDALVIPGGESTTILKLLGEEGFRKLKDVVCSKPVFGTCAGAILLARNVTNPAQKGLGILDVTICRNAYGRQINSSIRKGKLCADDSPLEMVFIRAPRFEQLGPSVQVLAMVDKLPVLVRDGMVMAATFHPELTGDARVHEAFLDLVHNTIQDE